MIRSPIHVFLFALYPVLFLYVENITEAPFLVVLAPAAALILFAVFLLGLHRLVYGEWERAAITVSLLYVVLFSFGHVRGIFPLDLPFMTVVLEVLWIGGFFTAVFFLMKSRGSLQHITKGFNAAGFFLVGITVIQIVLFQLQTTPDEHQIDTRVAKAQVQGSAPEILPDVYFIIMDRYASNSVLQDMFSYDNKEFLDSLTQRGFVVTEQSLANYLDTSHSLTATLNMNYVQDIPGVPPTTSGIWSWLYKNMENNSVVDFFNAQGYTTIHVGSWWGPTRTNENADFSVDNSYASDFSILLYSTTLIHPFTEYFHADIDFLRSLDLRKEHYNRFGVQLESLRRIPDIDEPTFTFAHILMPHSPYVYDRNGVYQTVQDFLNKGQQQSYVDQLQYANTQMDALMDTILTHSEEPPIIILQADEGPYPFRFKTQDIGGITDWDQATDEELRSKVGILSAVYFPGIDPAVIPQDLSPVNDFRLLLNAYFGTAFEILPNHSYRHKKLRYPYDLDDISAIVQNGE
ncbi:MAG: sulfatase-like hydrolase/transferase [Patescibacteria group bacterium]|jgi:hypothetical protein